MKLGKEADEVTEEVPEIGAVDDSNWMTVMSRKNRFNKTKFINYGCPHGEQCGCDREIQWIEREAEKEIFNVGRDKGWEKIRVQIDSGAVDTVGPKEIGQAFKIRPTKASKDGRNYVAANGSVIKNWGERLVRGETEEGIKVTMPIQIADVKRVLMSVHKLNQAGLIVVLDGKFSYFKEKLSGKTTKLHYSGGRYYFDIWTEAPKLQQEGARRQQQHQQPANSDDMEVDEILRRQTSNKFWILSTDGDENSGFPRPDQSL